MANDENILAYKFGGGSRTAKQEREMQRKGGIKSGETRRKKKSLLECARRVLEADIPEKQYKKIAAQIGDLGEDENTLFTASVAVMVNKALNGNVHAFNSIKDIVQQIEDQNFTREVMDDPLTKALEELGEQL